MPWEKSFDLDEAVNRAQKVFWDKGYEATSLSDLTKGMGINKGSLYNAFGSKKSLFTRALLSYDRDNRQKSLKALEGLDNPVDAISQLFSGLVDECLADDDRKGCFLVNTALELPNHDQDIQEMVRAALSDLEAFFARQIAIGQAKGTIPNAVQAEGTAKTLLSLVVGARVLSRGAFEASALEAIRQDALRLIS